MNASDRRAMLVSYESIQQQATHDQLWSEQETTETHQLLLWIYSED